MRRIRVTYIIGDMIRGGAESLLWEVVCALDPSQFEITLISVSGSTDYQLPAHVRYCELKLTSPTLYRELRSYQALNVLLQLHPCDILHSHLYGGDALGLVVGMYRSIPLVYSTIHNTVEWPRAKFSIRASVEDWFLRRATRVITVSNAVREFAIHKRHTAPYKTTTLYNGLNFDLFVASRNSRSAVRARLGIADGVLVLMCVAQFRPEKRHDLILAAFEKVLAALPDARLLLVGSSGSRLEWVQTYIRDHHLEDSVIIRKATRGEVADYCAAADVYTMHSEFEGHPLSLLEAMAAGLPVAVPALPEFRECVREQRDGVFFPFADIDAHAASILSLWHDTLCGNIFWRTTSNYITHRFSLGAHIQQLTNLYRSDLERELPAFRRQVSAYRDSI